MAAKNGYDTKIAVLAEQVKQVLDSMKGDREDSRTFRDDVRKDLGSLRSEVISRADRHDESDQRNFKAIDDRMTAAEKIDVARTAVEKYKRWQIGLITAAALTIFWNVIHAALPYLASIAAAKPPVQ